MNFSLQVNGQVRYADSKTPAENVLVRIESFSGGLSGQMVTDRTGKFSFSGLNPVQYVVTLHASGYIDVREDVNLATSNTAYLNILLQRDKSAESASKPGVISILPAKVNVNTPSINILENIPQDAQNEYSTGKSLLDQGEKENIKEAILHFEKALSIYPKFLDAQLMLGLAYMDSQDWGKAEQALRAAIEIGPQASTAYFALGEVYRREKKYADAEKILIDVLKANETSAEGHNTLAKVYFEMAPAARDEQQFRQYLENAWKEVSRSLVLDPKLAEAHLLAGNLLLKARRADASLVHFEEYLKLEPKGEFAAQTAEMVKKIKAALPQQKANN